MEISTGPTLADIAPKECILPHVTECDDPALITERSWVTVTDQRTYRPHPDTHANQAVPEPTDRQLRPSEQDNTQIQSATRTERGSYYLFGQDRYVYKV